MQNCNLESAKDTTEQDKGTITTDGGEDGDIDLDTIFHILRSGRRRLFLEYLRTNGPGDFRDIAEFVAGGEYGPDYSKSERKRVYISLYQNHVEEMDEAGMIQWSGTGGDVKPGENFREVAELLKCVHKIHEGRGVDLSDGYDSDDGDESTGEEQPDEQEQEKQGVTSRLLDRLK